MKDFLKNIKTGLAIGIGFVLIVFLSGVVYSAWTNIPELKKSSGEIFTSATWNNLLDNVDYLSGRVEGGTLVSAGAVVAFNLQECPSGRKAADGTNGTPDLRGMFIRGANSFDAGKTSNPRDEDRKNSGEGLGTEQEDAIRNIKGTFRNITLPNQQAGFNSGLFTSVNVSPGVGPTYNAPRSLFSTEFNASKGEGVTVGADNRPKNIALIYCVKE